MLAVLQHEEDAVDSEGWFSTGDIATLDPYGYMQITDRLKDVIKSGGEWISSIEVENIAASHPKVIWHWTGQTHSAWHHTLCVMTSIWTGS